MPAQIGRLEHIWSKRAHRGPMDALPQGVLVEGQGLEGSVGRSRRRQLSLLSMEAWQACMSELGGAVDPSRRRANVGISGIDFAETRGRILRIGDARIAIGGELTPCERMDEALPGLQEAMRRDWRGGAFGQVITGGIIRVGDTVAWETDAG